MSNEWKKRKMGHKVLYGLNWFLSRPALLIALSWLWLPFCIYATWNSTKWKCTDECATTMQKRINLAALIGECIIMFFFTLQFTMVCCSRTELVLLPSGTIAYILDRHENANAAIQIVPTEETIDSQSSANLEEIEEPPSTQTDIIDSRLEQSKNVQFCDQVLDN